MQFASMIHIHILFFVLIISRYSLFRFIEQLTYMIYIKDRVYQLFNGFEKRIFVYI
jgi:hypothetical protein